MLVWLSINICNWLANYLSIYISMSCHHLLTLPFHSDYLSPSATALWKRSTMVQMFSLINILNCLPPLIFVLKHIYTRLTILTGSKNIHNINITETLQWPVGSRHAPLGLQIYYFINSENADHIDYLYG